jgi:NitT/TauT family transport system substrate-binding protein
MSKGKIFAVVIVWLTVLVVGVFLYRILIVPSEIVKKEQKQAEAKVRTIVQTSAVSKNLEQITISLDSFSGYAIYRSTVFKEECAKRGFKLNIVDDKGDFVERLKNLSSGNCQMALFTIDALVKASSTIRDLPGAIIWISDESHGADAIVASSKVVNIDSLNDMEIFITENSPSDMLTLIVKDHFDIQNSKLTYLKDVNQVFEEYKNSKISDKKAFVLWEPYVSKVLENKDYKVLIDSEKFRDYIVDTMVASRDFLVKHPEKAKLIAEAYFTSLSKLRNSLKEELLKDAKRYGANLTPEQIERMAKCIQFKNTQENYAHFGLVQGHNLQNIEIMISEIIDLQLRSKSIEFNPSEMVQSSNLNPWYYPGVLVNLQKDDFRPGKEEIQQDAVLPSLSPEDWKSLKPVGSLQVPKLVFRRGSSTLSSASEKTLEDLVAKLNKWTVYYLVIKGNAASDGDIEANRLLAEGRANSAKEWLVSHGISANRILVDEIKPNGSTTVNFILAEKPY